MFLKVYWQIQQNHYRLQYQCPPSWLPTKVRKVYEETSTDECGPCMKLTASQRLEIAKRAAEMGTTSAI